MYHSRTDGDDFCFRTAVPRDLRRIEKIMEEPEFDGNSSGFLNNMSMFDKVLAPDPEEKSENCILVAVCKKDTPGLLGVRNDTLQGAFLYSKPENHHGVQICELFIAYVRPAARGHGIAEAFLKELLILHPDLGLIRLQTANRSHMFWYRHGFRVISPAWPYLVLSNKDNPFGAIDADGHTSDIQDVNMLKRCGNLEKAQPLPPDKDGQYQCGKCGRHHPPEKWKDQLLSLPVKLRCCFITPCNSLGM